MSKKPLPPSDMADKFMLRLPDGMRDQLKEVAEKNGRSMNAEIVQRLQESLDESQLLRLLPEGRSLQPTDPHFIENLDAIRAKIEDMQRRYQVLLSNFDKPEIEHMMKTLDAFNINMKGILDAGIPLESVFPNAAKKEPE